MRQVEVKNAWDQLYFSNDHLLFCGRNANVELSALHPSQVQVFKLWQVYLDNVNPLLKVTHTPTLQARIIDAAGDVANISPPLEALMFAIYCIAVFSLSDDDCRISFGTPRQDVLRAYQLGAREALLRCDFLRSADRDCLTAFHLYLVSQHGLDTYGVILTLLDYRKARHRSSVPIIDAWNCCAHSTADGYQHGSRK